MEPPNTEPTSSASTPPLSGKQQYNVVSDVIVGVNVRWRDNLIQAAVIALATIAGAAVGWVIAEDDRYRGTALGALVGLISGTLLSGAALMIFRFVRHARGRHD